MVWASDLRCEYEGCTGISANENTVSYLPFPSRATEPPLQKPRCLAYQTGRECHLHTTNSDHELRPQQQTMSTVWLLQDFMTLPPPGTRAGFASQEMRFPYLDDACLL